MKLKEFQGKEIFKQGGIRVPSGFVVSGIDEIKDKIISFIKDH